MMCNNIQDAYKQIHENISGMKISQEQKEALFAAEANKIMTAFKSAPIVDDPDAKLSDEEQTAFNNAGVVIRLMS